MSQLLLDRSPGDLVRTFMVLKKFSSTIRSKSLDCLSNSLVVFTSSFTEPLTFNTVAWIKRWHFTFLQTKYVSYHLRMTCIWTDLGVRSWRGWWWHYNIKKRTVVGILFCRLACGVAFAVFYVHSFKLICYEGHEIIVFLTQSVVLVTVNILCWKVSS